MASVNQETVDRDMSHDDPTPFPVVYAGIIGSIVVVLAVLFVAGITQRLTAIESGAKSLAAGSAETRRLRLAQEERLATGDYIVTEMELSPKGEPISVEKKLSGLKITDAMALIVRDPKVAAEPLAPPPPTAPAASEPAAGQPASQPTSGPSGG